MATHANSTPVPGAPLPSLPASLIAALVPSPAVGEYRALTVYDEPPKGCFALGMRQDRFAPHLRRGEWAVIDEGDREPASGEIFLVKISSPRSSCGFVPRIVQLHQRLYAGEHGPTPGWFMHFEIQRDTSNLSTDAIVDRLVSGAMSLCEGPMNDGIRDRIIGRVVGVILEGRAS